MEEPSVLDYVIAKLMPWRGPVPEIPPAPGERGGTIPVPVEPHLDEAVTAPPKLRENEVSENPDLIFQIESTAPVLYVEVLAPALEISPRLPWRTLSALGLALLAQVILEPGAERAWTLGFGLYCLAFLLTGWAAWVGEWRLAALPEAHWQQDRYQIRWSWLFSGLVIAILAFFMFSDNRFTGFNIGVLLAALCALLVALWQPEAGQNRVWSRMYQALRRPEWHLRLKRWHVALLGVAVVVIFYRVYRIIDVPPEMVSDQAEKMLDVWDILHGETRIFFPRNTGREALQMYLTAAIIRLFATGYTYLSLKIGTVLAGLLTLPYIYLLGKEVANRRVALLAVLLAGVAYWPNVISRVGLRFPLYPLFVAPVLYYLLRGLRTGQRNQFILSGILLGIGLHGYTPIRILPFVILVIVAIYLFHNRSQIQSGQVVWGLTVLVLFSLVLFLPLLRYSIENPEMFAYRSFTRLGTVERPLPGPAWQIFISNFWNAMTMFAWDDGDIWVTSVTHRPALDVASAALFYLGSLQLLVRYLRRRTWQDLALLLAVPLLLMPSILSLAFPDENPSLNRMAGAIVPVFVIAGMGFDGVLTTLEDWAKRPHQRALSWAVTGILLLVVITQNYRLVFVEYQNIFLQSSWNTSEMGTVIRSFATSLGSADTAYVVAFPHWVDTRLVGMQAGYPLRDFAIQPDQIAETVNDPRPKLFLARPDDDEGLQMLHMIYPEGVLQEYASQVENHNFYLYFVPPTN